MNFRIVDGRDLYSLETEFSKMYNSKMKVADIISELNISMSQYNTLRKHCAEEGLIDIRVSRPRKPKRKKECKGYHRNGTLFAVKKKGIYYATAKTEKEAQLMVERFEKCDWDKSQSATIINEVKKIVGR